METSNDQTIKADAGKAKLSLVPPAIIFDIARVREYGNNKYPTGGPDNWKQVEPQRYRDATFRHLLAYLEDPNSIDEESGIKHLWHLACNIAFLCQLEKENTNELCNIQETGENNTCKSEKTFSNNRRRCLHKIKKIIFRN